MCLGHVYIVLEPVGSARLTFGDDRYYEFMCLDVPKVVRSPRYDHGHDEESRNGRDIMIDILDGYIRTPEGSGSFQISFGVPGVTGTPFGKLLVLMGLVVEERKQVKRCPPAPVYKGWRRGGRPAPRAPEVWSPTRTP